MSSKEIKRNRSKANMKTVREELFKWLCKKHATYDFLDRHALREKALELTRIRGFNGFKCSEMWLTHFLKQHGFRSDHINQGNPKFADYRDWIKLMRPTITKYRHKDLFHVDELIMYSDMPPSNLKSKEEDDSEEPQRNRITVLMGCDASGTTKLPLLMSGPYPSRITAKEHVYCHSEDSRISDGLFRNWLTSVDDRMVRCKRKILLFLKRSRAQALQDFVASNVRLIYLPDNFPPHLRPLRRDVFHYVKMVLRRRYAELLKSTEEWGLREILTSVIEAWETIPRELLIFSFQRTHFRIDDSFLQIDCDCWNNLKTGVSFKKFVTFDDRLSDESNENDRLCNEYRLRNVVQIHEDTDSVTEDGGEVEGSSQLSIQSDWDCWTIPSQVQSQYQSTGKSVTSNYEKRNSRKRRLAECPIEEGSGEQDYPKKKSCATQCSTKRRRGNFKATESTRKISPSTSLKGGLFKEDASQKRREANEARESLQAVMDKALHLLMSEKAKYVRNLIESMYVDTTGNVNSPEQSKHLSVGDTDPNPMRSEGENEGASFSVDQPSVSTVPTSNVNQNEFEVTIENPTSKITSPKVNQNNEGSLSSVDDEVPNFSTKRRRRESKELDACEDDYQGSEPRQKKSKVDHDWSKKYETTFVFGSPDVNCSSTVQHDDGIVDSCIINVTPRD